MGTPARDPSRACECRRRSDRLATAPRAVYLTGMLINESVNHRMPTDRLSLTLTALADPTRRAILARLAEGEASVGELAEPFDMSLPAISRHLKVLERAGLIVRGRDAQRRPSRLDPRPLDELDDWLATYRRLWEERFDRLDDYLAKVQQSTRE